MNCNVTNICIMCFTLKLQNIQIKLCICINQILIMHVISISIPKCHERMLRYFYGVLDNQILVLRSQNNVKNFNFIFTIRNNNNSVCVQIVQSGVLLCFFSNIFTRIPHFQLRRNKKKIYIYNPISVTNISGLNHVKENIGRDSFWLV